MDLNKVYKALWLYHSEGYSNYFKIASEAEINSMELVEQVLKGEKFGAVLEEYKQDEATGNFNRTYDVPKKMRLSAEEYEELESKYQQRLLSGKITIETVKKYLELDDVDTKQANRMIVRLDNIYKESQQRILEKRVMAIMEVLEMPSKWSIDKNNNIITVYPVPVLTKSYTVKAIAYKPNRDEFIPPEHLLPAYIKLIDAKTDKGSRRGYLAFAKEWVELREQGMTYRAIADKAGIATTTVKNCIKSYRKSQQEATV